jgi:hypothetical protein
VDTPTPFININLCADSSKPGTYFGSPTSCDSSSPQPGSQTVIMSPVLLINGVAYVPAIGRSSSIVSGTIKAKLLDTNDKVLFDFEQSLALQSSTDDKVVDIASANPTGSRVSIYRDPKVSPNQNPLCDDMRWGCNHKLRTTLNKVILRDCCSFTVPAPASVASDLFLSFSTDLKLVVCGWGRNTIWVALMCGECWWWWWWCLCLCLSCW